MPRSGSAWLSVFLSGSGASCRHEILADCGKPGDLASHYKSDMLIGAVDTGAAFLHGYVSQELPKVRKYCLLRDRQQSVASLSRLIFNSEHAVQKWMPDYPAFHYDQLFNLHYLRDLWAELIGTSFDEARAEQLLEMNIQRDLTKLGRRAIKSRTQSLLLG